MSKQRWQPPSMNQEAKGTTQTPKVKVDDQVVRKMLKVNPGLRAGRTTGQVKRDLESGQPLVKREAAKPADVTPASDTAAQLRDTIRFFLSGKADAFARTREDIDARRKALDEELASQRAALREQVLSFVKLLDRGTVEANEAALAAAFAEQSALMRELGLDSKIIASSVRKTR